MEMKTLHTIINVSVKKSTFLFLVFLVDQSEHSSLNYNKTFFYTFRSEFNNIFSCVRVTFQTKDAAEIWNIEQRKNLQVCESIQYI